MTNRWMHRTGLALIASGVGLLGATGAPRFYIRHWDTSDGLPQNSVISIIQSRDGYLWLGTLDGLARFDGVHFQKFYDANTPGLDSTKIVKLFEDSRTNLWIGTEDAGIVLVDRFGKLQHVEPGSDVHSNPVTTVCEDGTGSVWLRLKNGNVYALHDGKASLHLGPVQEIVAERTNKVWIQSSPSGNEPAKLIGLRLAQQGAKNVGAFEEEIPIPNSQAGEHSQLLIRSRDAGYWFINRGRVTKCRGGRVLSDYGMVPGEKAGRINRITAACEDMDGNPVVGTDEGVSCLKQGGGGMQISSQGVFAFDGDGELRSRPESVIGLTHNKVLSLCVDREGSLWVGTDGGGLDRITPQTFVPIEEGQSVRSVCEDSRGRVWVASSRGLVMVSSNSTAVVEVSRQADPDQTMRWSIVDIYRDRKDNLWAGTAIVWDSAHQRSLPIALFSVFPDGLRPALGASALADLGRVSAIFEDQRGQLWVGAQTGLGCRMDNQWRVFTASEGVATRPIAAITADRDGNLWIGTEGGGLNHFANGKFTIITRTDGLPSDTISSLYVDEKNVLWAGSSGGLARYQNGRWTRYTTSQGLINDHVGYVLEDDAGCLWLGSTAGLTRVRKQELNDFAASGTNEIFFRHYGVADGMPSAECVFGTQPAATRTHDGRLLFCTIKGIAAVNPADLRRNTNPPPVMIEAVLAGGELQNSIGMRVPLPGKVIIPPQRESLEIHFTSLNLAAPLQGKFEYRMAGYETTWAEKPGNIRFARYPRLPAGDYTFQVRAFNEDNVESASIASIAVQVLPPFWQTMWFRVLLSLLIIGIIAGSVYYVSTQRLQHQLATLRQQEALERERARIARDLHDQLGANLTQVALLGELAETDKNEPSEVESHARQISQTARETTHALDEIVWTVNPSNDTLDGLINYVCKYAQEYLAIAGLRYRLDVPSELPNTPISPELRHNLFLAAKETINNVVKHSGATSAWLRLELQPRGFVLEIADDGKGLGPDAETKGRSGLKNMRKRMDDLGGRFEIGPREGGGTVVRLTGITNQAGSQA